jgi:hypothetical protein
MVVERFFELAPGEPVRFVVGDDDQSRSASDEGDERCSQRVKRPPA